MPQEVVGAPSLEVFKNRLDKFMDSNDLGNKKVTVYSAHEI